MNVSFLDSDDCRWSIDVSKLQYVQETFTVEEGQQIRYGLRWKHEDVDEVFDVNMLNEDDALGVIQIVNDIRGATYYVRP